MGSAESISLPNDSLGTRCRRCCRAMCRCRCVKKKKKVPVDNEEEEEDRSAVHDLLLPVTDREMKYLDQENLALAETQEWLRFDSFFAIFVVLNGFMVAVETDMA